MALQAPTITSIPLISSGSISVYARTNVDGDLTVNYGVDGGSTSQQTITSGSGQTTWNYFLSSLKPNTSYTFQIWNTQNGEDSEKTEQSFITKYSYSLIESSSTGRSPDSISFYFGVSIDSGSASQATVYYTLDGGQTETLYGTTYGTMQSITLSGKTPNSDYYVQPRIITNEYTETNFRTDGAARHCYTLAPAPTLTLDSADDTSIILNYSTQADGGAFEKEIQYSLDGGTTWTTGSTVSTGSASSGSFTIQNLTPGTSYTIQTRSTTSKGSTSGSTLNVQTTGGNNHKIYVPVEVSGSIVRKEVSKVYVPVNVSGSIVRKAVSKVYVPVYDSTTQTYKRKLSF